jgi:hypothetical protein
MTPREREGPQTAGGVMEGGGGGPGPPSKERERASLEDVLGLVLCHGKAPLLAEGRGWECSELWRLRHSCRLARAAVDATIESLTLPPLQVNMPGGGGAAGFEVGRGRPVKGGQAGGQGWAGARHLARPSHRH